MPSILNVVRKTVLWGGVIDTSMKIVVAVDNTNASIAAAREALSRAQEIDGNVVFVSCIDQAAKVNGDMITTDIDAAQRNSKQALQKSKEIATEYDVDVETTEIPHESVVEGILEAVEQVDPEFVYVGHRQLGTNGQPVSSVAKNLISRSPVPVTVVTQENGNGGESKNPA